MRDHFPPGLPPDPFAGDPSDPSAALDAIEPGIPLDDSERMAVEEDLADLEVYETLLAQRGVRGLVVMCEDCREDHYHDWEMLRANLLQLLLDDVQLLVVAGGFSYADALGAGRMWSLALTHGVGDALQGVV
ncbi:phosphoribosylformylglycinamidine synthase subunit PurQ, partial [Gordonia sp. (in: high G+C Gram-positive bacteria)]|uniref:phosphoribosylformylglycinamidine synthase subunit PurQ n=1 Tax=Gordonia sp. (in: high G+C Gram-positive bacteria) TaxID=84139 RepID=UPI002FD9EC6D